jgi:hypothetical protein
MRTNITRLKGMSVVTLSLFILFWFPEVSDQQDGSIKFQPAFNPYLNFRLKSLPEAKKDAKEFFNSAGAFNSDVTDRCGYYSSEEFANHTPVAEMEFDFWRQ